MSELHQTNTKLLEAEETVTQPVPVEKPPKKSLWKNYYFWVAIASAVALTAGVVAGFFLYPRDEILPETEAGAEEVSTRESDLPPWIDEAFLTLDGESRTGRPLDDVLNIAVHYVANPGTSAMANRNYFEGPNSDTSSHFIVGLEGEVLAVIPLNERSCATNERNVDTISVEVCHPDASGEFSPVTYDSLIRLLAYLCDRYELTEENLIRHYDVTGKMCPRYYVENPDAWEQMKMDVKEALAKGE